MPGADDEDARMHDPRREDEELSRLYRAGAREEPPAKLDQRILAAARQQTRRGRHPRLRPLSSAWTVPVSLAAVIVLSVSLVLVVQLEDQRARAPLLEEQPAPAADAAPPSGDEAGRAASGAQRLERAAPREALEGERATTPVPSREEALRQRENSAASVPEARKRQEIRSGAGAPEAGMRAGERSRAKPASAPPSPHVWLAEIEQLLASGEVDAARESLARFRERYPDYPVPASVSAGVTAPSPE